MAVSKLSHVLCLIVLLQASSFNVVYARAFLHRGSSTRLAPGREAGNATLLLPSSRVAVLLAGLEDVLVSSETDRSTEALPAVLQRAHQRARTRLASGESDALLKSGYLEFQADDGNSASSAALVQALTDGSRLRVGSGTSRDADAAEAIIQKLSKQLTAVQGEIDAEHSRCQADRAVAAIHGYNLQRSAQRVGARGDLLDSQVARHAGDLTPSEAEAETVRTRLQSIHEECDSEATTLKTRHDEAVKEFAHANKVKHEVQKDCVDGASSFIFLGRQVRRAREVNMTEQLLQLPPSADKPEPAPESAASRSGGTRQVSFDARERPNCQATLDTLEDMERAAKQGVDNVLRDQAAHDSRCQSDLYTVNIKEAQKVSHLASVEVNVADAVGQRSEVHTALSTLEHQIASLVQRVDGLQASCMDASQRLEDEACGLIELRQALYWRFVGDNPDAVIQDCEVGKWVEGACSKTCTEEGSEERGSRMMRRVVVFRPSGGMGFDLSALGAECPALVQAQPCGQQACPVDCEMGDWSGWASCSRKCGGGEQLRTRSVDKPGLHGGKMCELTVESTRCNTQACQGGCVLGDWSQWGTCSRRCRFSTELPPGRGSRVRSIATPAMLGGSCPSEAERTQYHDCNEALCPEDVQALRCNATQDIVFVLDGSGSTVAASRIGAQEVPEDQHFLAQKAFVEGFIAYSALSGDPEAIASNTSGLRYGVVVFGGQSRPEIASQLTGERAAVLQGLSAAAFPKGETHLGQGLLAAHQLFRLAAGEQAATDQKTYRPEAVVLITDGKSQQPEMVAPAARRLKDEGVRVMAVLVQDARSPSVASAGHELCGVATAPCADNVLTINRWDDLSAQMGRFMAAICTA